MKEFTDENFQEEVLSSDQLVLVAFTRPGCGPCSLVPSIMENLEKELGNKIKIGILNTFENPETPKKYKIPAVPVFIIYNKGEAIEKAVGLRSKEIFINKINELLLIFE